MVVVVEMVEGLASVESTTVVMSAVESSQTPVVEKVAEESAA